MAIKNIGILLAKAPWRYNPDSATMITFENPESIQEKVHYAIEHQLGGVFFGISDKMLRENALLPLLSEALSSFLRRESF